MLFSNILSTVWPGNWEQFVPSLVATIIGTVIGIFGPFYMQSVHERCNKKIKAIQCLSDIKKELNEQKEQFTAIQDSDIYLNPIRTPVWDSLINTNEIQLLYLLKNKDKTSSSINFVKQLFQIYDLINEYNLWCNMYTQGAVVGARSEDELLSIKVFIDELKKKLLCENVDKKGYEKSIKYTIEIIEKIEQFNS